MATRDMRTVYLPPRQWDRIVAALAFAANHSRDFCSRENNLLLAKEIIRRLETGNDRRERARDATRRYRERQKTPDPHHDPDANNLAFDPRHPMEVHT